MRWSKTWKPASAKTGNGAATFRPISKTGRLPSRPKQRKNPETFREQHRAELTAYQAAAAYFKAHNIQKLPSLKQLKAEREELISEKAQFYQKYREAHKAWLDLATAQQNLEALHRAEGRREMTRGGLHELDK